VGFLHLLWPFLTSAGIYKSLGISFVWAFINVWAPCFYIDWALLHFCGCIHMSKGVCNDGGICIWMGGGVFKCGNSCSGKSFYCLAICFTRNLFCCLASHFIGQSFYWLTFRFIALVICCMCSGDCFTIQAIRFTVWQFILCVLAIHFTVLAIHLLAIRSTVLAIHDWQYAFTRPLKLDFPYHVIRNVMWEW